MPVEPLDPDQSIFQNEDALRDHYPDRILERDEKLEEYLGLFSEVVRNKRPRNVFVYGPTGVGKTIGTKAVLEKVHESIAVYDYDSSDDLVEPSLHTIHMECKDLNTSYQVAAHLVNEFRQYNGEDTIKTTGYPESEIYRMLFDELRSIDASHVLIALDEIDNIGSDDNILYKLPRCNNDTIPNHIDPDTTAIGVIGITNDGDFKSKLDARTQSTLCDQEIHFPPYNAHELESILSDRASEAFVEGACNQESIRLAAALAANRSGYARTALDLLYEAGDIADSTGADCLTEDIVREAEEKLQRGSIVTEVESLSRQAMLITYTIFRLQEDGETPAKLDKVYARYKEFATKLGASTIASRSVNRRLNELMMNSIVHSVEVNEGVSGGRHYEYELGCGKDLIMEGLRSHSDLSKIDNRF